MPATDTTTTPAGAGIAGYLADHESRSTLRFVTCGSVDDGKSTLIGRLLYESNLVLDDHLSALQADSRKLGTRGADLDFALLVDGLQAEREQGITIDVAYRYFTTARRQFIVADTPGHVQYTRNMVTGASTADLAVILVDATRGLSDQTRRHTHLIALMGLQRVILAVNKLDLVGFDQGVFSEVENRYRTLAEAVGIGSVTAIPLSAVDGDNLTAPSPRTRWYSGQTLLDALESAPAAGQELDAPLRFGVQWVNRPDARFRGLSGSVVAGSLQVGDEVVVLPAGTSTRVARIVTMDADLDRAPVGSSVTLTLADDLDVSRGDVLCAADHPAPVSDRFAARLVWMSESSLDANRNYLVKINTAVSSARLVGPLRVLDVATLDETLADTFESNDIGRCEVHLDAPVTFEAYHDSRDLGGFILIDRLTNDTVAAGMIEADLAHRSTGHSGPGVSQPMSPIGEHAAGVVWLTGLSGAGKSTIAGRLEGELRSRGLRTFVLDGDELREGLCSDLGFSAADRAENIRRAGEVARLLTDAGLVVIAAFISPYEAERRAVRERFAPGRFVEVFVDTPLGVAEQRDPKGLYARVRRGELENFTGVDAPYEAPRNPEVHLETETIQPADAAERIAAYLQSNGIIPGP